MHSTATWCCVQLEAYVITCCDHLMGKSVLRPCHPGLVPIHRSTKGMETAVYLGGTQTVNQFEAQATGGAS